MNGEGPVHGRPGDMPVAPHGGHTQARARRAPRSLLGRARRGLAAAGAAGNRLLDWLFGEPPVTDARWRAFDEAMTRATAQKENLK